MKGGASSSSRRPASKPRRRLVGEGASRNRGRTRAFCGSGAAAVRRASSRTNPTAPTTTLLQLSSALTLGDVVEPPCGHPAVVASGHQILHSRSGFGPTASVSTIEKRAARNTGCSPPRKGKSCASHKARRSQETLTFSPTRRRRTGVDLRDFSGWG